MTFAPPWAQPVQKAPPQQLGTLLFLCPLGLASGPFLVPGLCSNSLPLPQSVPRATREAANSVPCQTLHGSSQGKGCSSPCAHRPRVICPCHLLTSPPPLLIAHSGPAFGILCAPNAAPPGPRPCPVPGLRSPVTPRLQRVLLRQPSPGRTVDSTTPPPTS